MPPEPAESRGAGIWRQSIYLPSQPDQTFNIAQDLIRNTVYRSRIKFKGVQGKKKKSITGEVVPAATVEEEKKRRKKKNRSVPQISEA